MADAKPEEPVVAEKVVTDSELKSEELAESASEANESDQIKTDEVQSDAIGTKETSSVEDAKSVSDLEIDSLTEPSDRLENDGASSVPNEQTTTNEQASEDPAKSNQAARVAEQATRIEETRMEATCEAGNEEAATVKKPSNRFRSVESFEELGMPQQLLEAIRAVNIEKPNALQKLLLPETFTDRAKDFYFKTNPHAGKKAAIVISSLNRIEPDRNHKPQVIILTPTSELGEYVYRAATRLAGRMNIKILQPTREHSAKDLMSDLIVTSIHGLVTFMERRTIDLSELKCLIFDEVDLLLGNEKNEATCSKIIGQLVGKNCQLLFFSTFYGQGAVDFVRKLKPRRPRGLVVLNLTAGDFMKNILQFYCRAEDHATKLSYLIKVLQNTVLKKIVVYVNCADGMADLDEHLRQNAFQTVYLTSNTTAAERLDAIDRFNSSEEQIILITHYPLTHGIRLNDVRMCINFDLPSSSTDLLVEYVHRIKRSDTTEQRPCFVVNMTDSHTSKQFARIQKYFQKNQLVRMNLEHAVGPL